jgi:pyrroloquinoline quinone biosynthesis protein D
MEAAARPRLTRAVRLRHDRVRDRWMLLGPERGFVLSGSALAIVRLCDGTRTLGEIAGALAAQAAPATADVAAEVTAFVADLQARGLMEPAP